MNTTAAAPHPACTIGEHEHSRHYLGIVFGHPARCEGFEEPESEFESWYETGWTGR